MKRNSWIQRWVWGVLPLCLFTFLPLGAVEWEDNHVLQVNREPARAYFIPYAREMGDRQLSLNGTWKFRWTKRPEDRVMDFYRTDYDCSDWADFPVPANWEVNQIQRYGTPIYVSAGYPFTIPCSTVRQDWGRRR